MSIPYNPNPQYRPFQQHPIAGQTPIPQTGQGMGNKTLPGGMPTWNPATGTFQMNMGGTTPIMQQVYDAQKSIPLPTDLTGLFNQMGQMYGSAMGNSQSYYDQMNQYAQQLNAMLGQNIGQSEHEQLMAMNRPIQHPNQMTYLYGY